MTDPHCSKCCPVKPPAVEETPALATAAWAWLAVIAIIVVGGWWLIVWLSAHAWH